MNRNLRATFLVSLLGLSMGAGAAAPEESAKVVQQKLAAFQGHPDARALDTAWPYLDSEDAGVRQAARLAVEAQPLASWKQRALDEKNTWASLEILRALVEVCPRDQAAALSPHLCEQITTLRIDEMNESQQLAVLQLIRMIFVRLGPVSTDERAQMLDLWSHLNAPLTVRAKAELTRLLDFLEKAPTR